MSIPKVIHYCWFGGNTKPPSVLKCIDSWKEKCPDYTIKEWNEDNFDININQYVKEAYEAKKYAFVTDYVRLYVLKCYGGIYMDTDVEVIKPLDMFLSHRAFSGCENDQFCVTGILASEKNHPWIEKLVDDYKDKVFVQANGQIDFTPNTKLITDLTIREYGWIAENSYQELNEDIAIYPFDYFCAKDWRNGKVTVTKNTHTIHHFSGSWKSRGDKFKSRLVFILGPRLTKFIVKLKKKIRG